MYKGSFVVTAVVTPLLLFACAGGETTDRREPSDRGPRHAEVQRLKAALERNPKDVVLLRRLASEHWALGEYDSAQRILEDALSVSAGPETRWDLIGLLYQRGRYVDAAALARGAGNESVPAWLEEIRQQFARVMNVPESNVAPVEVSGSTEFVNSTDMTFVTIAGGTFTRGADDGEEDSRPARRITVGAYLISKHEVTQEQFKQFLAQTGHRLESGLPFTFTRESSEHPAFGISWKDAQAYTMWLSAREHAHYRLPTEAEWEFAARGTAGYREPWGNEVGRAQLDGNWGRTTVDDLGAGSPPVRRVGSFLKDRSPVGLLDMAGNVQEWCLDDYDATYYSWSPTVSPYGPVEAKGVKVLRGGSWNDPGPGAFAIRRSQAALNQGYTGYGFRVVREIDVPRRAPKVAE